MSCPIIDHLAKLDAEATPRPWRVHENPRFWVELPVEGDGRANRDNDAAFVAATRNALPAILRALRAADKFVADEEGDTGDPDFDRLCREIRALRALEGK